jgi:hypothetical protein
MHWPRCAAPSIVRSRLPTLDFSRDILMGEERLLRALPVPRCGWSDLGTPQRVAEALKNTSPAGTAHQPASQIGFLNLAVQHARLNAGYPLQ